MAISLYFHGTSFCFINSHLTSGDERWLRWVCEENKNNVLSVGADINTALIKDTTSINPSNNLKDKTSGTHGIFYVCYVYVCTNRHYVFLVLQNMEMIHI